MDQNLLFEYFSQVIGPDWKNSAPKQLSGWDVVEALWPLNNDFRNRYRDFVALPYEARFEGKADLAQQHFVFKGKWPPVSIEVWRVILERHQQAIQVALANELAGNSLMPIPDRLPRSARTGAAVLYLLQQMKLPFAVVDRAGYSPDANPPHS
ncbi:hypothetical protein [Marinobacterium litorale]|uniref:hypothetical protein n=1 Tax=Marinobacterium litorale TaxID=404770 RepID=UPI0012EC7C3F|nr:hypothetical protein [Marinobacterium litorale]